MTGSDQTSAAIRSVILLGDESSRLWGISGRERLRRAFRRAGLAEERLSPAAALPAEGEVIIARMDYLYEESLVRALVGAGDVLLTEGAGGTGLPVAARVDAPLAELVLRHIETGGEAPAPSSLRRAGPGELGSSYDHALRKRAQPYLRSMQTTPRIELERLSFAGAYKGVTDFVTKWLWPAPAMVVTRWAAQRGISPNSVTFVSLIFVLLALWLFAEGMFAAGLVAAWVMTFLDTVDGKLARVTLTSTKWGNVFDHGIDLIHPPFWYWAWWYGLGAGGVALGMSIDLAFWIVFVGYFVGRALEGLFIWQFGIELHAWRRVDSWFRLFTARRNPNLAILTAAVLLGRPDAGLVGVAFWTVASTLFHVVRIGQAFLARNAGRRPVSWLAEPEPHK